MPGTCVRHVPSCFTFFLVVLPTFATGLLFGGAAAEGSKVGHTRSLRTSRQLPTPSQAAQQQLEAAATSAAAPWMTSLSASIGSIAQPVLADVQQDWASANTSARDFAAREGAQAAAVGSVTQILQGLVGASTEFARSKAQNAMVNIAGPALKPALGQWANDERLRADAVDFSVAAETASSQVDAVAQVAKALSANVSAGELLRAESYATAVEKQSSQLQDEALLSDRLSTLAVQVSQETAEAAERMLEYAVQANTTASSALRTAEENERELSDMRDRAQAAEQQASSVSGGVSSVTFSNG